MPANAPNAARPAVDLDALLLSQTVWKANRAPSAVQANGEPTGHAALDDALPQRGWPRRALTELLLPVDGIGELTLLLPTLARLTQAGGIVVLVAPPYVPYAPAWQSAGVDLQHLEIIDADPRNALWAFEQCLRSAACAAVIGWPLHADGPSLRRLQVAADSGDCLGFALRDRKHAANPSPAALRMEYVPVESYRCAADAMTSARAMSMSMRGPHLDGASSVQAVPRRPALPAPMTRSLPMFPAASGGAGGGALRGETTPGEAAGGGQVRNQTAWSEHMRSGRFGDGHSSDHSVPRDPPRSDLHRDGRPESPRTPHVDAAGIRALAASARAQRAGIEDFACIPRGDEDSGADRATHIDRGTANGHWHVRKCRGNLPLRGVVLQESS